MDEDNGEKLAVTEAALMYSDIRHLIGIIEGAAIGVKDEKLSGAIFNSAQLIIDIVDELYGIEPEDYDMDDDEDEEYE